MSCCGGRCRDNNNNNFKAAIISKIKTKMQLCLNITSKAVDHLNSGLSSKSLSRVYPRLAFIIH